jgi:hypothetical protein
LLISPFIKAYSLIEFEEKNPNYSLIRTYCKSQTPYLSELDFSNSPVLNFQFKLGKNISSSNWKFKTGEFEKSSSDR